MKGYKHQAGPCPNCAKPNGAIMLDSRWPHSYSCCSEACGSAFVGTKSYWMLQLEDANTRATRALAEYRQAHADAEHAFAAVVKLEAARIEKE